MLEKVVEANAASTAENEAIIVAVQAKKMNGKLAVFRENSKSVLDMDSGFEHKLLCTGPVLNLGDACGFSCAFCYVPSMNLKLLKNDVLTPLSKKHEELVVRRKDPLNLLAQHLRRPVDVVGNKVTMRVTTDQKQASHVVYSSSTVDIAANVELMKETADACTMIFEETAWEIRLLTKSALLPKLVKLIPAKFRERLILGVSTGTFDDRIGKAIEQGAAPISKRIASLRELQDEGYRTYAMVCPSLPQKNYDVFAEEAAQMLRYEKCEHVWAEAINLRGESFTRTIAALDEKGLIPERDLLALVSGDGAQERWEAYTRATFEAHEKIVPAGKLRYLQYVTKKENVQYWNQQQSRGAVLLGRYSHAAQLDEIVEVIEGTPAAKSFAVTVPVIVVDETMETKKIRRLIDRNKKLQGTFKAHVKKTVGTWLENAITVGEYFSEAKERVGHGKFLNWLTTNFAIDRKTGNNYMAIAAQKVAVQDALQMGNISHFTKALTIARQAARLEKQEEVCDDIDVEASRIEILEAEGEEYEEDDGTELVDAPGLEKAPEVAEPFIVGTLPEEAIPEIRAVLEKYRSKNFQIIWKGGERKLNESLARQVTLLF